MRLALCLLLLAAFPSLARAGEPAAADALFREANQLLQRGNVAGAITVYEEVLETGYASAALYYNLGNAHLQREAYPQAVLNYLRALRLDAADERVAHNLLVARERLELHPGVSVQQPAERLVTAVFERTGMEGVLMLLYIVYLAAAAVLARAVWSGRLSPWNRRALYLLAPALVFLLSLLAYEHALTHRTLGVVMTGADAAALHEQMPGEGQAPPGTVVQILGRDGGFARVRLPDGSVARMPEGVLAEV